MGCKERSDSDRNACKTADGRCKGHVDRPAGGRC